MGESKKCTKCGEVRLINQFYKHKSRRGGVHSWCKECCSQAKVDLCEKISKERHTPVSSKKCSDCRRDKLPSDFYRNKTSRDGLQNQCKACQNMRTYSREEKNNPLSDENIDKRIAEFFND